MGITQITLRLALIVLSILTAHFGSLTVYSQHTLALAISDIDTVDNIETSIITHWQKSLNCARSLYDPSELSPAQLHSLSSTILPVTQLHKINSGEHQKIALLSTGVTPSERLPNVHSGNDYIGNSNGLEDCDGIGTAIAGIIGAAPSSQDSFVGVAPQAQIYSYRIMSEAYTLPVHGLSQQRTIQNLVNILTTALDDALHIGANIIVIPQVLCYPQSLNLTLHRLKSTIQKILWHHISIIVGNPDGQRCLPDESSAHRIITVPTDIYPESILTVFEATRHDPAANIQKPTEYLCINVPEGPMISLSNDPNSPGLANGFLKRDNSMEYFTGSMFASGYISALIALLKTAHPHEPTHSIFHRIRYSAIPSFHNPQCGYYINAFAALTWQIPNDGSPEHTYVTVVDKQRIIPEKIKFSVLIIGVVFITSLAIIGVYRIRLYRITGKLHEKGKYRMRKWG